MTKSAQTNLQRVPPSLRWLLRCSVSAGVALNVWPAELLGQAPTTALVSIDSSGSPADNMSFDPALSPEGRFIAFMSWATDLAPDAYTLNRDVFLRDRVTGQTVLIDVNSSGQQADDEAWSPSVSASGAYVAFYSRAGNLAPSDNNNTYDVFVRTRLIGQTTIVSVSSAGVIGNGSSTGASITASGSDGGTLGATDGRFVAFTSLANNLVANDTNGVADIFVHDRDADGNGLFDESNGGISTVRANVSNSFAEANSNSGPASISSDGTLVAFWSFANNLVLNDTNGCGDVFVRDLAQFVTTRVSVSSSGQQANDDLYPPVGPTQASSLQISANGRYVAFFSHATNLVPNDTNGKGDIFVHDRQTATTVRVSVTSAGVEANDKSQTFSMSGDGRHVAFTSWATNLGSPSYGAYLHDRDADADGIYDEAGAITTTYLASLIQNVQAFPNTNIAISPQGTSVAYPTDWSLAAVDSNGFHDVYVTDTPSDRDGDALLDAWEYVGIDVNGNGTLDSLTFLGGDPLHKDMYIEIDAMVGRAPSDLNPVAGAFAFAPLNNPDGQLGIILRTQATLLGMTLDETNIPAPGTAWAWPPASPPTCNGLPAEFCTLKTARFGTAAERADANWANIRAAKLMVYRYCVFADRLGTTTIGGVAEQPGNDFTVTLGGWANSGSTFVQQGMFMHELGHCLNLGHGGGDTNNYKPNYHSVMNYTWTVPASPASIFYNMSWTLDYSRAAWPTLNEASLNEPTGIGGHPGHWVPLGLSATSVPLGLPTPESGAADFDRNGSNTDTAVTADLNLVVPVAVDPNSGVGTVHTGFNDWSNIRYQLTGPNFNNLAGGEEPFQELTYEIVLKLSEIGVVLGDITGDGVVDVDDLLLVVNSWGLCDKGEPCDSDLTGNGIVDVDDLLMVINNWS